MIYTTYFTRYDKLQNKNLFPVSIAKYSPKNYTGDAYSKLMPSKEMLFSYKQTGDVFEYASKFLAYLNTLNADEIVSELESLSNGKDIVLLCYENPYKFCHRTVVRGWLIMNGYECEEL